MSSPHGCTCLGSAWGLVVLPLATERKRWRYGGRNWEIALGLDDDARRLEQCEVITPSRSKQCGTDQRVHVVILGKSIGATHVGNCPQEHLYTNRGIVNVAGTLGTGRHEGLPQKQALPSCRKGFPVQEHGCARWGRAPKSP